MTRIAQYLLKNATTANPRFNFQVPETVYDDLLAFYTHVVNASEREMRLTPDTEKILRSAANWMRNGKRGLLLYGSCGTGKTKLMQALSHLFAYYSGNPKRLRILSANEIIRLSLAKDEEESRQFVCLKTYAGFGIDDLGTEPVTVKNFGTVTNPVTDILLHRYDAMKMTLISTNLDMKQISEKYTERIHDRLCEQYDRIVFYFPSFRQM